MKNLLSISLFMAFVLVSCIAYAQKPAKQTISESNRVNNIGREATTIIAQPACWKITGENGDIEFRWDTETNVRQWINEMQSQHNEIYTYKSCNHQTVEACDANNEKSQPKKCWKITGSKNGQGYEQYLWSTETVARRKTASLQSDGYQQAKYVETPANEEKSCHAPENTTNVNPNEPNCWKIKIGGNITYMWGYERDAQATVNAAINSGHTASYELSPNGTKDSCR